jgi:hypothetical protein
MNVSLVSPISPQRVDRPINDHPASLFGPDFMRFPLD